jgi:regulator of sigma E protease
LNALAILAGLAVLVLVVLIHEAGHCLVAKALGIPVPVFSVGFGPRLAGFTAGGTDYRISAIPFGGYVRLGEEAEDAEDDGISALDRYPKRHRFLMYLGGIAANTVTAWLVAIAVILPSECAKFAPIRGPLAISEVTPGGAAAMAGVRAGDVLTTVKGQTVHGHTLTHLVQRLYADRDKPILVTVTREGRPLDLLLTVTDPDDGVGFNWDQASAIGRLHLTPSALMDGVKNGTRITAGAFAMIWGGLRQIVTGHAAEGDLQGPIGIVHIGADAIRKGWREALVFFLAISTNLALVNALPLPGLDGGHLGLLAIEAASGKPLAPKVRAGITYAGAAFLALVMLAVLTIDIRREVFHHRAPSGGKPPAPSASADHSK